MSAPRFSRLLASCLFAIIAMLCGGAAGRPTISVRFHVEAIGAAGGSFTMPAKLKNPPRDIAIESVPFASERNITAIYPVLHPDGAIGCAFQLDQSGALGLETVSTDRRGASMVVYMASKQATHQVIDMPIDKRIRDGIIYIPRGLTPGELELLRKKFPMMAAAKKGGPPAPQR